MEREARVVAVGVESSADGFGSPAVLIQAGDTYVPIFVSPDQAQSVQLALDDQPVDRPMTHDLLIEMVTDFGGAIDEVRIDDLVQGTYFATIRTEHYHDGERRVATFDARPSDAIAIALRVDSPIRIDEEVFTRAGRPADEIDIEEFPGEHDADWDSP